MGDWRSYRSQKSHGGIPYPLPRSKNRHPPPGQYSYGIPSWEKKFCYHSCSISWKKLLEAKKSLCYYTNVADWNDSAGEEAFHNAKARYWAKINGMTCNISPPDPDKYLDKINWNCYIDPKLVAELENTQIPIVSADQNVVKSEFNLSGWDAYVSDNPAISGGWNDDLNHEKPTGWDDDGWNDVNPSAQANDLTEDAKWSASAGNAYGWWSGCANVAWGSNGWDIMGENYSPWGNDAWDTWRANCTVNAPEWNDCYRWDSCGENYENTWASWSSWNNAHNLCHENVRTVDWKRKKESYDGGWPRFKSSRFESGTHGHQPRHSNWTQQKRVEFCR